MYLKLFAFTLNGHSLTKTNFYLLSYMITAKNRALVNLTLNWVINFGLILSTYHY